MLAVAGMSSVASAQEEPRRADGLVNTYYIYGAQPTPEIAEQFHFIMPGDLSRADYPDSYYTVVFPNSGVLQSTDKSLIKALFPDVKEFKMNGTTVSESEFYAVPGQVLTAVRFADGVLSGETRADVNDDNPYWNQLHQDFLDWLKATDGTPLPANVALNDPDTYFEAPNTIVTLDYEVTTPAKVKEKASEIKGYAIGMLGANPQVFALTHEQDLEYFSIEGDYKAANLADIDVGLTPANIAEGCELPLEDLLLVTVDRQTVKAYFKKH